MPDFDWDLGPWQLVEIRHLHSKLSSSIGGIVIARVGDRILVRGHRAGQPDRRCIVLELHHDNGEPPYLVQWDDTEHPDLYFPGSDATVVSDTTLA